MKQETIDTEQTLALDFKCPRCKTDMTSVFTKRLSITTGLPEKDLQNGGLKALPTFVSAGKLILEVSGIKFDTNLVSEKTTDKITETIQNLLKPHLEDRERHDYDNKIEDLEEKLVDSEKQRDKIEREFAELKTKVSSNSALKGSLAEAELMEELEYKFEMQKFEDISSKGNGDILWKNIRFKSGDKLIETNLSCVVDSKDKGKITDYDIEKLRRDMKFHNERIGLIITVKQEQLRAKEIPAKVYESEEGYVIVTSRENEYYCIALNLISEVLTRALQTQKQKKQEINISKLQTILNDIATLNEYFAKIKSNTNSIIKNADRGKDFLDVKLKEARKSLLGEFLER